MMAHLSPSAIFSPSLARQQLAAAKDWNYIDAWLSTKYAPKSPPPFERNAETLKVLLALVALNESADEERELRMHMDARALQEAEAIYEADLVGPLLASVEDGLTREGEVALSAMANLSVTLNQPLPDIVKLGKGIVDLQVSAAQLEQASDRITVLEAHLNRELETINNTMKELQSDAYQPPEDMTKQTTNHQRKAKALASKLPELKDRILPLSAKGIARVVTLHDINAEEEKYRELLGVVKELETQVKGYHGLPQDTDLARLEIERLRVELRTISRKRDSMFEGLVERESPRK